jgi:hypothetical protein
MTRSHRVFSSLAALVLAGVGTTSVLAAETRGAAQGETSQQKSQQGLGLDDASSSNVIVGGPEIIIGKIASIKGDEFMVEGNRGQFIRLRVTKDTNMVCAEGQGTKMSTSREGVKERKEIPISPATEGQMKSHDGSRAGDQRQALNDPNQQQSEHQMGAPAKDPSTLKDVVGSTDEKANQDIARGSGFVVGGSSGCQFKQGDLVRIEASDMGTATTVKGLSSGDPARSEIAEGGMESPRQ